MKKMLPWLATSLLAITLIVVVVFVFMQGQNGNKVDTHTAAAAEKKMTADEIVAVSSELGEIKTNLADIDHVVVVSFSFKLSDKKAKEDFEKIKEITVKPIIIQTFADTKSDELATAKGRIQFNKKLTELINEALPEGKLASTSFSAFVMAPM
ncbi:flagellar basal body-associated FliL family protein [Paenibacillus taichungensis]|uniref:flagellar basal body-associated FliL family protein n=1 Tax=Paenibacillus TaxID=44249 RepID=UPI00096EAB48|nr:flagellar basal body-associated FliL family protein [Paenibacillus taichungensis]MDR9745077.1 flagellar basal body-associated FliL family protein [Paenibacillus taichungensis]MEC0109237.1 flagellar basal body-associated FliL family protein [Paenibacillus taichungensis]MEC0198638.1 flagellar basal body-associated FliL family protein [Paenibacillus taichungensis]OME81741.1 flagellar basal body protein FliL [Paenibacillus pabuli]